MYVKNILVKEMVKLWYLVVKVSMDSEFGFDLPFEEGVMELLVVDVDFSHLGTNLLPHFSLHSFGVLL